MEWIGEYQRDTSPDRFQFMNGVAIKTPTKRPSFVFDIDDAGVRSFDILPNNAGVPLVSEQTVSIINGVCKDDVQYFPASVITRNKSVLDYYLVNVSVNVGAVDLVRSDLVLLTNTDHIMKINRVVCVDDPMKGHHLARESAYKPFIWASDKIKETFEENRMNSCKFTPYTELHP